MTIPTSYGSALPGSTLSDLWGFLEEFEIFEGKVYNDKGKKPSTPNLNKGNPTIGFGFNLTEGSPPTMNSLGAFLNSLVYTVTLGSGGPTYAGNVFQVAYQISGGTGPTTSQILQYFENLCESVKGTSGLSDVYTALQNHLNWALQGFFLGLGPELLSNSLSPTIQPPNAQWVQNVTATFPSTASGLADAQNVISNLLTGNTINEQGTGGTLTITGKSPTLWSILASGAGTYTDPVTHQADVDGAPPNSDQWEALVAQAYEGSLGQIKTVEAGLSTNDPALVWFDLRDLAGPSPPLTGASATTSGNAGQAKRDFAESQLFGLNGDSTLSAQTLAFQDYEVLTQYRSTIIPYEQQFGDDPDGNSPTAVKRGSALYSANAAALTILSDPTAGPGVTDPTNLASGVQTLAQTFAPEEATIVTYLEGQSPLLLDDSTFGSFATSTNIFVAGTTPATEAVNAALGDYNVLDTPLPDIADSNAEAYANHIILGSGSGDTLIGGLGNDIIVAGTGNETLNAGFAGSDTLIAGDGSDTLNLSGGDDTIDFEFDGLTGLTEVVNVNQMNGVIPGTIYVAGSGITGPPINTTPTVSNEGNTLTWSGTTGFTYSFTKTAATDIGTLTITGGSLGSGAGANSIVINDFNLQTAVQNANGFMGIVIPNSLFLNASANAGVDPPAPNFAEGSNQSYTVSVDVAGTTAQSITLTLTGAPPSSFEALVGDALVPLSSSGTFTVTIPAGSNSTAFSLMNTGAVANGDGFQLTASMPNALNPTAAAITSTPLPITYAAASDNPYQSPTGATLYGATVTGGGSIYSDVTGTSAGNVASTPGGGEAYLNVSGVNENVTGGTGADTVDVNFGGGLYTYTDGGTDVFNGDGGTVDFRYAFKHYAFESVVPQEK